ncbi:hypothetical protein [Sphingomonas sp. MMS24-J13]|uniref:hypothetical protein n=1 Tax=Sphingomonas sp. MMS24-J13 TaxID=3238686 RepID=UPI00384F52CC
MADDNPPDRFRKLVAIIAPPRSGTTVVTAALSVHSDVVAVFEPWNANMERIDSTCGMTFDGFVETFVPAGRPGSVLVVKETATYLRYIDRIEELVDGAPPTVTRHLVVILRNPFHAFLSEVQARREWWGAADLEIDAQTFALWAKRMLSSCRRIADLAESQKALLLGYDAFGRDINGMQALTRMVGLEPERAQFEFEKHLDRSSVRGDLHVSSEPRPISPRSIDRREIELASVVDRFSATPEYPAIVRLAEAFATLPSLSFARQQPAILSAMRGG